MQGYVLIKKNLIIVLTKGISQPKRAFIHWRVYNSIIFRFCVSAKKKITNETGIENLQTNNRLKSLYKFSFNDLHTYTYIHPRVYNGKLPDAKCWDNRPKVNRRESSAIFSTRRHIQQPSGNSSENGFDESYPKTDGSIGIYTCVRFSRKSHPKCTMSAATRQCFGPVLILTIFA